jgi:hypothetical protein
MRRAYEILKQYVDNREIAGLTLGLKGRRVYPEVRLLFSIPYQQIPVITRNLENMEWVLPAYTDKNREEFLDRRRRVFEELNEEFGNQKV